MKPILGSVIVLLATVACAQTLPAGMYARSATPVWDLMRDKSGQGKPVRIPSPDRSRVLLAKPFDKGEDSGVELALERGHKAFWTEKIAPGVGIEIGWAPDSKAFFVTTSNAGRNGGYELAVYLVSGQSVQKRDVTPVIQKAFGHPVRCGWEEDANVAAVKWMDSKSLIVAAEIVAHSNCDSFGTFRAYKVAVPDLPILKQYGQIEAKRLFAADLGWELRDAPDKCIKDPKSCWVAENHSAK